MSDSGNAVYHQLFHKTLLGLCNNYCYVVMLSAAVDLLKNVYKSGETDNSDNKNETEICYPTSAGAVLVADIIPALIIKAIAPFILIGTHFKVLIVVALASLSFLMTALSNSAFVTYFGIVCASLASGLGEVTFLGYTSLFDPNVISTWSSGTGGAGLLGSFSYAGITSLGLSPKHTLLLMLIVPFLMSITFWVIIVPPPQSTKDEQSPITSLSLDSVASDDVDSKEREILLSEKLIILKNLLKYMVPLALVYYFEYFINQGLADIIYFKNSSLSHDEQYRWYQVVYQCGVLVSRSSVNLFKIRALWLLPILQGVNVILLLTQVMTSFIPSIWIVFTIIFYEGLLGGAAYVNTFYRISVEVSEALKALARHKQFSMSIASLGDSFGITLSGFTSIPVHNSLCRFLEMK
ncbi:Battenin-like protein [Leptotrombidium deliense]|uniref:Battenin n=1 Tax=Leptotrombidium deliense TaxID=299467 RepID=A0A443SUI9_9ACAR|nr:Battenin-like protein [Leptotrombidium deliense]